MKACALSLGTKPLQCTQIPGRELWVQGISPLHLHTHPLQAQLAGWKI